MSRSIYIGPYLEVPYAMQPTGKHSKLVCSENDEHQTIPGGKFCPVCGNVVTKFTLKPVMTLQPVDLYDLIDDEGQSLVWQPPIPQEWKLDDNLSIYIGNIGSVGHYSDAMSEILDVITLAEAAPQAIKQFTKMCSDLIKQIKGRFPIDVTVKYGIVTYWS